MSTESLIVQTSRPLLTLRGYQDIVVSTDQKRDSGLDLSFPLLGLFGETGSLLSEAKKKQRDAASYLGYSRIVVEELGDVLWYLTIVAARSNLSITDIGQLSESKSPKKHQSVDLSFASLQPHELSPQSQPIVAFEKT